jgi:hypothetical protein
VVVLVPATEPVVVVVVDVVFITFGLCVVAGSALVTVVVDLTLEVVLVELVVVVNDMTVAGEVVVTVGVVTVTMT